MRRSPKPATPESQLKMVDGQLTWECPTTHGDYAILSCIYEVQTKDGKSFVSTPEAQYHDEKRLPHLHSAEEIARLFPVVRASDEVIS